MRTSGVRPKGALRISTRIVTTIRMLRTTRRATRTNGQWRIWRRLRTRNRTGILKFSTNFYNSNHQSALEEEKAIPPISTSSMNFASPDSVVFDPYQRSAKRQVRLVDPRINFAKKIRELSKSPYRSGSKEEFSSSPFIPKNADYRVVPGALMKQPIDFSKVIEQDKEQSGDQENLDDEQIDPSEVHRAEPYFEFFTKTTVKSIFSKRWQSREEGLKALSAEIVYLLSTNNAEPTGQSDEPTNNPGDRPDPKPVLSEANMLSFSKNKEEWMKLVWNAVERGLNDKIMQVKIKAIELYQNILDAQSQDSLDIKELKNIIGILVDFLSEPNNKLRDKSFEALKTNLNLKYYDYNEVLTMVISKTASKNKAYTRYNHSKLAFLIEAIEEAPEDPVESENAPKKTAFPTGLFLDFVEKMIVLREKTLTKETREKMEKAYLLAYKRSSYADIKEYMEMLDASSMVSLSKHIPEIDASALPKESEEKQREEDTNKKLIELRKERLKSIKLRKSFKKQNDYQNIEAAMTDVENTLNMVKEISSREKRNRILSVDPEVKQRRTNRDDKDVSSKTSLRKSINTNLEILKGSVKITKQLGDGSRNYQRNTTPMRSKNDPSKNKSFSEIKQTERTGKKSSKHKRRDKQEENKEKIEVTTRSNKIKIIASAKIKWSEWGDDGFKDIKELTKHQHKYWKAFRKCKNCEKLLRANEYDTHIAKKWKNKNFSE